MGGNRVFTKATTALIVGAVAAAALFRGPQMDFAMLIVFIVWGVRVLARAILPHKAAIIAWAISLRPTVARQVEVCAQAPLTVDAPLVDAPPVEAAPYVQENEGVQVFEEELSPHELQDVPATWYEVQGKSILEKLIIDLNVKQYNSLTIKENGEICIAKDAAETVVDCFSHFPEKKWWEGLVKVLETAGLSAVAEEAGLVITW